MLLYYCLKCVEKIQKIKMQKLKNGRIMLLSNCEVCDSKKWEFIK